ncbi:MAG: glycosyltransferase family 87 protein [Ktedonobacterales bacterium]
MAEIATQQQSAPATTKRRTTSASGSPLLRVVLRITLCLLLLVAAAYWVLTALAILHDPALGFDFGVYYAAALALRDAPHANIYNLHVIQAAAHLHHAPVPTLPYLYPSLLAVLLLPLAALPFSAALAVWNATILLLWLLGTALLARWIWRIAAVHVANPIARTDSGLFAVTLAIFLSLLYGPFWEALHLGQVSVLVFFLVLLAPLCVQRNRPYLAGGLLALAAAIKLFPVVLLGYYLLRGQRRVLWGALIASGAFALLILVATGGSGLAIMRDLPAVAATDTVLYQNQSLAWVPRWLTLEAGATPGAATTLLGYILIAAVAATFAATIYLIDRNTGSASLAKSIRRACQSAQADSAVAQSPSSAVSTAGPALAYSWALVTMVLVSPVTWMHHDAWLLPAFIVCAGYALRDLAAGIRNPHGRINPTLYLLAAVLLGYLLTMNLLPFGYDGVSAPHLGPYVGGHPLRPLLMLLRPLGTLLLWAAAGILYLRAARPNTQSDGEQVALSPSLRLLTATLTGLLAAMIALWTILLPIWYI